ncbi:MAG: kanE [Acidobacteria bacterium]|nr:kanE [Acidobacteriota bacterium]
MGAGTVLVCAVQVPLVEGGAEDHVRQLVSQLRARGYRSDLVAVPYKWYPKEEIFSHAAAWRLLDLSESNGERIDCVIATRFPSYCVRHPNKAIWLLHQHRAAYDLCGAPFCPDFGWDAMDVAARDRLIALDTRMIAEARRVYANSAVVAARLEQYNGLSAQPLHHPPRLAPRLRPGPPGDYVLSVGRLETLKRVDLAVRALALAPPALRLVVAGDGPQRPALEALASEAGVGDRVRFAGRVDDEALVGLYSGALAVVFAPFDEDYGYVTLEAMLSAKPVVTARDSGGVLEFARHGVNALVCEPSPGAMAEAFAALDADRRLAASLGEAGRQRASEVTWDGVIEKLLGE